jgi:hypothetical protein
MNLTPKEFVLAIKPLADVVVDVQKKVAALGLPGEFLDRMAVAMKTADAQIDKSVNDAELVILGFASGFGSQTDVIHSDKNSMVFGSKN